MARRADLARGGPPRRCCRRGRAGSRRSSRRGTAGAAPARRRRGGPPAVPARQKASTCSRERAPKATCSPRVDRVLGVGRREREVVPLGEARVAVGRLDAQRLEHRVVEGLRRGAVGDPDGHVVEHSEQPAQRGVLAHVVLDLGLALDRVRPAPRAPPPRRPRPAAPARARPAGRGSPGASRARPRRSRAPRPDRCRSARRRGTSTPRPTARTSAARRSSAPWSPAPAATAWRCVAGSGTKTYVPAGASKVSPSSVNVARPRATK